MTAFVEYLSNVVYCK